MRTGQAYATGRQPVVARRPERDVRLALSDAQVFTVFHLQLLQKRSWQRSHRRRGGARFLQRGSAANDGIGLVDRHFADALYAQWLIVESHGNPAQPVA